MQRPVFLYGRLRNAPSFCLLACILAWMLVAAPCLAQEPAGPGLMLWQATLPAERGTAYLLGTIHEAPPDLYPLDQGYMDAFDAADRVVVEIDTSKIDRAEAARYTMQYSTLPENVSLREVIGPELWSALLEEVDELGLGGLPPERLGRFQPLPVAFMLLMQSLSTVQVERGLGIEAFFLEQARKKNMPVGELEGLVHQLKIFAAIPLEQQTRYLAMILEQGSERLGESYLSLADAWQQGDLDALAEIVRVERESDPALDPFYAAILEGRNPAMADEVEAYIRDGGVTLVLVGTAHLHGELGILELLEGRGASIERIPARGPAGSAP